MAICWYCHWGWSEPVAAIYRRYLAVAGESAMHYGPAHIVWEDENFERESVQGCLDHVNEYRHETATDEQHAAVKASLEALLALPDDLLDPCPMDYDNENPTQYPPAVKMVPRP